MILSFVVPGEPVAWARAGSTTAIINGKPVTRRFTPKAMSGFEDRVAFFAGIAVRQSKWSWVAADRFAVAIRIYRTHEGRGGDLDNYAKGVNDALNGVAFADDRYIRELSVVLAQDAKRPRTEVDVTKIRPLAGGKEKAA